MRKGSFRRLALGTNIVSLVVQLGCFGPRVYLIDHSHRSPEYLAQQAENEAYRDKKNSLESAIAEYIVAAEENKDNPCEYAAACFMIGSAYMEKRKLVQERENQLKKGNDLFGAKRYSEEAKQCLLNAKRNFKEAENVNWRLDCPEGSLKETWSGLINVYNEEGNEGLVRLYSNALKKIE